MLSNKIFAKKKSKKKKNAFHIDGVCMASEFIVREIFLSIVSICIYIRDDFIVASAFIFLLNVPNDCFCCVVRDVVFSASEVITAKIVCFTIKEKKTEQLVNWF